MKSIFTVAGFGLLLVACQNHQNVPCETDANCDLGPGGTCVPADTGHHWCAYPYADCPSGFQYSNDDVGDSVGGACTSELPLLAVTLDGNGQGHITSSPAGIDCPGACAARFSTGTVVTLSETPSSSVFLNWTNTCSGHKDCTLTISSNQQIGATFAIPGSNIWTARTNANLSSVVIGVKQLSDQDIIMGGRFNGTITPSTLPLTTQTTDGFVARIRSDDGSVAWIRQLTASSGFVLRGIAVDAADDVSLIGDFSGAADFNGTSATTGGLLVAKMSGADGTSIWQHVYDDFTGSAAGIATNTAGDVFITGQFSGRPPVPDPLASTNGAFLIKYAKLDGALLWGATDGGGTTPVLTPISIAIGKDDDVVLLGSSATSAGNPAMFIAKYDGSTGLRARECGSRPVTAPGLAA
jgi:hypothetical protein